MNKTKFICIIEQTHTYTPICANFTKMTYDHATPMTNINKTLTDFKRINRLFF